MLRSDCNTEEAWSKPVGRLRSTLESWKNRSLTFTGKSTVINVLLFSQHVYIGTILTIFGLEKRRQFHAKRFADPKILDDLVW